MRHEGLGVLVGIVADAMEECLELEAGDTVAVVYDNNSSIVAQAIGGAAEKIGVKPVYINIDDYSRPLTRLPEEVGKVLEEAGIAYTFYVAGVKPGELPFRSTLIRKAIGLGAGHVHMPKATPEILMKLKGCRKIANIIMELHDLLRGATRINVESPAGTMLEARVGKYRWKASSGIIGRREWGNWPPGEVFTTPTRVDGILVVDGVIGDYFSTKYGLLEKPVTLVIENSIVTSISGGKIAQELHDYIAGSECGKRVGELGIGGNINIEHPIGNMLHDEKMPGAHLALGDPLGEATGAEWKCSIHVDLLPLRTTVKIDGETTIIENGKLVTKQAEKGDPNQQLS